jgi:outer membrane protein assembly factor BamD
MRYMKKLIWLLLFPLLLSSCSNFNRLQKSTDNEAKYAAAVKYYEKKDYYHALQLFEELFSIYRGTSKAEKSYYYYAYCTYYVDDYVTAAYHFSNFTQSYPNSEYAEEMQYMFAYCYFLDSPIATLDQTSTLQAIEKYQLFINKYPTSERVAEANRRIDELRLKLETKEFYNARLYFRTQHYKSAVTAFEILRKDYPSGTYDEEATFMIFKSQYEYARQSVEAKQLDRYKEATEYYLQFIDKFPQSRYLREAEKLYDDSRQRIGEVTGSR